MIYSYSVILLTVLSCTLAQYNVFYWKDCGDPTTRAAYTEDFHLTPDPLRFGQDAHYNATFVVLRDLPDDAIIGIELWRSLNVLGLYPVDVQVPCMVGSDCKVNLRHMVSAWRLACDFVRSNRNGDCDGPIVAQRYTHVGKGYIPGTNAVLAAVAQVNYHIL